MLFTYTDQSPAHIQPKDVVTDGRGRKFTATGYAAELYPKSEEFSVAGISEDGKRQFFDYMRGDLVSITCEEIQEKEDQYA